MRASPQNVVERTMAIEQQTISKLTTVSTATITTVLVRKGLRNVWIRGARQLKPGQPRLVGPAFTLRFVPAREDLATPESWSSPRSSRAAIEDMPAGRIAVADAMGVTEAGICGDILCARMHQRGVVALVTDGVVRDLAGVRASGLPVWSQGAAAPPSIVGLHFVDWQQPIACGGVAVFPGDMIVADEDGAVVIPQAMAAEVAHIGSNQELLESWIMAEVQNGAALPGLYPPDEANKERFEAFRRQQRGAT
jgi:regulator of RNase E activity RraA